MATPSHPSWHGEISQLSLFISLPQIIASPIFVGIKHLMYHNVVPFEVKEILDFLLISFPLTLCVAILFVIIVKGKFNLFYMIFAVVGATLLSNLLHKIVSKFPLVDIKNSFDSSALTWVYNIFGVYWNTFGPILFIQSCCIGIYAAVKYLNIEDKRKRSPA
jgi:hypothetical protein